MASSFTAVKCKLECGSLLSSSSVNSILAVTTDTGNVVIWDDYHQPKSMKTITIKTGNEVSSVQVKKSNPNHVYSACENRIHLTDRRNSSQPVLELGYNTDDINHIVISQCETYLCSADDSGQVKIVTLPDNKLHATLANHGNVCFCLAVVDGRKLLSGGYDCKLFLHDFVSDRSVQCFDAVAETDCQTPYINPPNVLGVDASSDSNYLAAALQNGTLCLWKKFRNKRYRLHHHVDDAHSSLGATQVRFLDDAGSRLVSGGNDGTIRLWSRDRSAPTETIRHGGKVNWLQILEENAFAVCDTSCELTIYNSTN